MSDGPHRSLPLPPHWKRLAERAATPAYAPADVHADLRRSLEKDFRREAPVSEVTRILRGDGQGSLFPQAPSERLEELRDAHPGSVPAGTLIDCAIEAIVNGLHGDAAIQTATARALEAHARTRSRQIVEHYCRAGRNSPDPSDRLRAARDQLSYSEVASELTSDKPYVRNLRVSKRSGLDEGPPL